MENLNFNSLVLAYIGDAIFEVKVREYLIKKGLVKVNDLQKEALQFVSAKRQALFLKKLLELDFFNEKEQDIIRRARNSKSNSKPKNCDIITYKHATALESIIGYLHMQKKEERIEEIFKQIIEIK